LHPRILMLVITGLVLLEALAPLIALADGGGPHGG
jgi:hypothetical protein